MLDPKILEEIGARLSSLIAASPAADLEKVEVHLGRGLPSFTIVGLADTEVKEARERVRAAIQNARFEFPASRITVNLAPADLPKESGRFDLPIALGILAASGQIAGKQLAEHEFAGELSLTGELRPIRGALAMCLAARGEARSFVLPFDSAAEAALVGGAAILPAKSLLEVCAHLNGQQPLAPYAGAPAAAAPTIRICRREGPGAGQARAGSRRGRRPQPADERPARHRQVDAGGALSRPAAADGRGGGAGSAAIHSLNGGFRVEQWMRRPYQAPHHTASAASLVGGGSNPRPGEISLAHHGVLFLDELPEFERRVLEALREPLESGHIRVARAAHRVDYPAQFQLVAAMNPCPCGHLGARRAAAARRTRWRATGGKLSGPLLDRIDL
jgi:magnesium chelatase family protein